MTRRPKPPTARRIRALARTGLSPAAIAAKLHAPPSIVARALASSGKRGQPRKRDANAKRLDGVYLPAELHTRAQAAAKREGMTFAAFVINAVWRQVL